MRSASARGRMLGRAGEAHDASQECVVAAVRVGRVLLREQVVEPVSGSLRRRRRDGEAGVDEPSASHRHEQVLDGGVEEIGSGEVDVLGHKPMLRPAPAIGPPHVWGPAHRVADGT